MGQHECCAQDDTRADRTGAQSIVDAGRDARDDRYGDRYRQRVANQPDETVLVC
jgi:hypothetical protein